jgi:D-alanyl-D-alanine carboxypeptidase
MAPGVLARLRGRRHTLRLAALGLGALVMACGRGTDPPSLGEGTSGGEAAGGVEPATGASRSQNKRTTGAVVATPAPEQVCLVTKELGVSAGYVPPDLIDLPARVRAGDGVRLRRVAAEALVDLIDSARKDGLEIFALSGYRSYEDQERVMVQEVSLVGRQTAEKQVAAPGHSEHQLGLAVDITSRRAPYELRWQFGQEPEGKWLAGNAPRFGFVISYPEGKEEITGYTYEPWHIRYVGTPLAEKIAAAGLTLTEYLPKHGMAGGCP